MGQKPSQQLALQDSEEVISISEVVSGAMVHAAQKLKEYLGFEDTLSHLCPAPNTLNEIFLIHFVTFCQEKGVDKWLTTTKMTKHQALLFGADWIWTFWGPDKQIRLQLAVQTLQMSSLPLESKPCDLSTPEARAEEPSSKTSRFDKLEEFCSLIGEDCLGLFIIFGVPGNPKDIRGVVLDSVKHEIASGHLPGGTAVARFILETEECVSIRELLGNCLSTTERTSKPERALRRKALPPRTEKMAVDQDWPSVYPVAAPFKPSAVPLPVRMGYPVKRGVPMAKEGNLELLKIPNFLHLTPVAIKRHCEALKDFCTEWPAALDSDEKCEKHFPIEIDTADYVSAGPSIRNPKARVVTLRVKLSSLNLDDHAKKKLIKLVGDRYCKSTDVLTIKTDRCPLKRQNYDYAVYLLTVLYHESWKTEEWEKKKTEADMEEYIWENSTSEKNILETLLQIKAAEKNLELSKEELLGTKEVEDYRKSVVSLKNEGDNENTLSQYKESVKRLLNLA
uniref:Mitochondrial ribosomal protein S35 n=1 Tax=Sus scrofa TaxID=9823 RepID=A0A8D1ZGV8_PIG